ncbi:hypothetical protein AAEO56_13455 [Flavobacterium sp. DGU11]|uniref:PrgI family protein n=1 Tax=Flavobacterium arundinis TaxID=3139143 RepID=A0ABU9HZD0_9FLAO
MENMPLFSNSCGKIYADDVVFAYDNGEKRIAIEKIKAVNFDTRLTRKALLLLFLPLPVFLFIYLEKTTHNLLRLMGLGTMLAIFGLAVFFAEKKYRITIIMADGSKKSISVSKANRKDAKFFLDKLKQNSNV